MKYSVIKIVYCIVIVIFCIPITLHAASGAKFQIEITPVSEISSGGGGGSVDSVANNSTNIILSGYAYKKAKIYLLRDGQVVSTSMADESGNFRALLDGASSGYYNLSVYAEDNTGKRSLLVNVPVDITSNVDVGISNLIIPPSVYLDKIQVRPSDILHIEGQAYPGSSLVFLVKNTATGIEFVYNGLMNDAERYSYPLDISDLPFGEYSVQVKEVQDGWESNYGIVYTFIVGNETLANKNTCGIADLNCDGDINLVDFSIAAFWYKKVLSGDIIQVEQKRLNGDGLINLVDFSIMAFHWTG